jgi:predicted nucleotide-binding protein (sugar kinase/HSP70/actin superfamily)
MKIVVKTLKKVVFEVSKNEMKNRGFDSIWDEIRESYPSEIYDLNIVDQNKKGLDLIFFELVSK